MELGLFKNELFKKANDLSVSLLEIEDYVYSYFKFKYIPYVFYKNDHLMRCSLNEPNELFKNVSRCSYNPAKKIYYYKDVTIQSSRFFTVVFLLNLKKLTHH